MDDRDLKSTEYIFLDLETTGLSPKFAEIIEFAAIKWKEGIIEEKNFFIKPTQPIPYGITKITSITNGDVEDAISIEEALPIIKEFMEDAIIVAHNSRFDLSFLNFNYLNIFGHEVLNPVIDTLKMSKRLIRNLGSYKLNSVASFLDVECSDSKSHRANYDARVCCDIYQIFLERILKSNIDTLKKLKSR